MQILTFMPERHLVTPVNSNTYEQETVMKENNELFLYRYQIASHKQGVHMDRKSKL
jgi:hypothetical protein